MLSATLICGTEALLDLQGCRLEGSRSSNVQCLKPATDFESVNQVRVILLVCYESIWLIESSLLTGLCRLSFDFGIAVFHKYLCTSRHEFNWYIFW